jgi:predicted phosphohydrolase
MKFQITSDLHFDFGGKVRSQADFDIKAFEVLVPQPDTALIVAGDICRVAEEPKIFEFFLAFVARYWSQVVLIAGNHEFYSQNHVTMLEIKSSIRLLVKAHRNIHFLDNESIVGADFVIWGGTLWSAIPASTKMIDYPIWMVSEEKISKEEINKLHKAAIESLRETIAFCQAKNKKLMVVSHYAPCFDHMSAEWKKMEKRVFYATDYSQFLTKNIVHTWVAGHTHVNVDTDEKALFSHRNASRFLCNSDPRKSDYNPKKVIDF